MVKSVSIEKDLAGLAMLDGRTAETSEAEAGTAFATPAGVTVLTAKPLPTDHSATDPRTTR